MACKHGKDYTRCIMRKRYGKRAFNSDGTLKVSYLRKEKARLKRDPNHSTYRMQAVNEAINYKHKR